MSEKQQIYAEAGIGEGRVGYGKSPVILVIDLQRGETDPSSPAGSDLSTVIEYTNEVIDAARSRGSPIVWVRLVKPSQTPNAKLWAKKTPATRNWTEDSKWVQFDDRLAIAESDQILEKPHMSAFDGTELQSMLTAWGADTLILTGCSTSGCVRATAKDAIFRGYRPIIPEDCVGERSEENHRHNLWEIDTKLGDVRPTEEVISYLIGGC